MRTRITPSGIGRWSARRPSLAIGAWLAFVVLALAALAVTGSKTLQNGVTGEAARAESMLQSHQAQLPEYEYAYLHSDSLRADDPTFRAAVRSVTTSMAGALGIRVSANVASSGQSVLLAGPISRPFSTDALRAQVSAAGHAGVSAVLDDNSGGSANNDLSRAERLSVPVTLLVLLIAFGALVAAIVPLLLGATAVIAAFGLLGPISQLFALDDSVKTVVLLIGMAVGVDYALFYVIRSREERARGLHSHDALERTARTSGHTVIVAGTTVAIAMAGQFMIGTDIFNGIAAGTIAVIACAVAGSVTVLPAVLELLGPRIDRGKIPFLPHLGTGEDSRFWPAVVERVLRRPVRSLVGAVALLLALAIPALSLHVAQPDSDNLRPVVSPSLQARIIADFPHTSPPAIVVVTGPARARAAVMRAENRLGMLAAARGIAHPPFSAGGSIDGQAAALELPLSGTGDDAMSKHALTVLRNQLIPQTLGRIPGVQTAVTGETARDVDFTAQMTHGLPYVIAFVLVLAFLILLFTFRSIVVPIKAIVLNLLSVAASYGVLVLVFQHHWAEGLLGFHSTGWIISWLPIFLFVVLFGLSMDYHVFILSRVREGIDAGMSNDQAVRYGIARTAGVVTSAALVMFGVFSLFGTASSLDLKQAGVGLAVAVILDATVVRAVLLPASMKLLGEWNWYLPGWLAWLPGARPGVRDVVLASRTHPGSGLPAGQPGLGVAGFQATQDL
jgi:RND superfamily putative drug exporter